jgi:hypothetical protein
MLWYKGWLETRIRLLVTFGVVIAFLSFMHAHAVHDMKPAAIAGMILTPKLSVIWICAFLAGSGIATQPSFQATKGLHGSTVFTLALPVSRLRLLAIRAFIGWVESVFAIGVFCSGIWLLIPGLRAAASIIAMAEFSGTLIASASALYFVSVLLATFLDDQWRIWGTMLVPFAFGWLSNRITLPAFADIFRAVGNGSPLITHTMPWSTVAFSLTLAAVLFLAALKIAQTREY